MLRQPHLEYMMISLVIIPTLRTYDKVRHKSIMIDIIKELGCCIIMYKDLSTYEYNFHNTTFFMGKMKTWQHCDETFHSCEFVACFEILKNSPMIHFSFQRLLNFEFIIIYFIYMLI